MSSSIFGDWLPILERYSNIIRNVIKTFEQGDRKRELFIVETVVRSRFIKGNVTVLENI